MAEKLNHEQLLGVLKSIGASDSQGLYRIAGKYRLNIEVRNNSYESFLVASFNKWLVNTFEPELGEDYVFGVFHELFGPVRTRGTDFEIHIEDYFVTEPASEYMGEDGLEYIVDNLSELREMSPNTLFEFVKNSNISSNKIKFDVMNGTYMLEISEKVFEDNYFKIEDSWGKMLVEREGGDNRVVILDSDKPYVPGELGNKFLINYDFELSEKVLAGRNKRMIEVIKLCDNTLPDNCVELNRVGDHVKSVVKGRINMETQDLLSKKINLASHLITKYSMNLSSSERSDYNLITKHASKEVEVMSGYY